MNASISMCKIETVDMIEDPSEIKMALIPFIMSYCYYCNAFLSLLGAERSARSRPYVHNLIAWRSYSKEDATCLMNVLEGCS